MKWAIAILLIAATCGASAQGTFQNLNFEEANVVPIFGQPYAVTVANALPGWTVEYNDIQQTVVQVNNPSLGATQATLIADGYPSLTGITAIDGNFSLWLQDGPVSLSLSQTGQIPVGTQSILFAEGTGNLSVPDVYIGSDSLTLFPVSSQGKFVTIYGANIPSFAGQTEQLTFSVPPGTSSSLIDDISFSPNPITMTPEPSPPVLMGIGGLLFALHRRFAPTRQ